MAVSGHMSRRMLEHYSHVRMAAKRTVALEDELNERGESGPAQYPEAAIDQQTPEMNLIWIRDQAALQARSNIEQKTYSQLAVLFGTGCSAISFTGALS